jgi:hypothetical protein
MSFIELHDNRYNSMRTDTIFYRYSVPFPDIYSSSSELITSAMAVSLELTHLYLKWELMFDNEFPQLQWLLRIRESITACIKVKISSIHPWYVSYSITNVLSGSGYQPTVTNVLMSVTMVSSSCCTSIGRSVWNCFHTIMLISFASIYEWYYLRNVL